MLLLTVPEDGPLLHPPLLHDIVVLLPVALLLDPGGPGPSGVLCVLRGRPTSCAQAGAASATARGAGFAVVERGGALANALANGCFVYSPLGANRLAKAESGGGISPC